MMMIAASINHLVNLLVSLLMVPLLLHYLDLVDFVVWSVFITFGAITLQFETAIQQVFVREIARTHHAGDLEGFRAATRRAKRAYRTLSIAVATLVAGSGFAYINYAAGESFQVDRNLEWLVFVLAYATSYSFGTNSAILLATSRIGTYFNINSVTRTVNLATTFAFLKSGLGVLGLALSFAVSVLLGCICLLRAARSTVRAIDVRPYNDEPESRFSSNDVPSGVLRHTSYVLASFLLYKGCFLVATAVLPMVEMGGYALALQACTILSSAAVVPVQLWLRRLVKAIASDDRANARREVSVTLVASSAIFLAGVVLLLLFGEPLLSQIRSRVHLPGTLELLLICTAFYVELLILVLASYLVTLKNFAFVVPYLATSVVAIAWVISSLWLGVGSILTLVVVPLALQLLVCLPMVGQIACRELGTTITGSLAGLLRRMSPLA